MLTSCLSCRTKLDRTYQRNTSRAHRARARIQWHTCSALPGTPQVMAQVMGAEAALMRIQFMSGTHAIASALYAVLRPGDEMLAVVGQ